MVAGKTTTQRRLDDVERRLDPQDDQIVMVWCDCHRVDGQHDPGCDLFGVDPDTVIRMTWGDDDDD